MFSFFEFFAGGGMVREGLGANWRCLFANDFDPKKAESYIARWGENELRLGDVGTLKLRDLPHQTPDLIWGSFPCQDLSLAGNGKGLEGERSGSFWPFWNLVRAMVKAGRSPAIIALENVVGTLTSHGGKDFEAIIAAFAEVDYDVGAMLIDAQYFVPQSRPRLFFIGVPAAETPRQLSLLNTEVDHWHPANVKRAYLALPKDLQKRWIWWSMPEPPKRNTSFVDIIEDEPTGVFWHSKAETKRLLSMMSPVNAEKIEAAKRSGKRMVGGAYRRTRTESGKSVQRVEVRFDEVSGCLRTPSGGSSRQFLFIVDGNDVRSRLISARETARLMGLPDDYELPANYNDAYHLTGDGVVVDVIRYLAETIVEPHLKCVADKPSRKNAAKKTTNKRTVKEAPVQRSLDSASKKGKSKAKTTKAKHSAKPLEEPNLAPLNSSAASGTIVSQRPRGRRKAA